MMRYTARDDWKLDQRLLVHDLAASRAHVRGLGRIGALTDDEVGALEGAIDALSQLAARGELSITPEDEDGHTAIENALVETLGELGKKVHLGRSRNDQVLVALRLYERDALDELMAAARDGATAMLELAQTEQMTPMPGYTHLQPAMPSSVGLWAASFVEQIADALDLLSAVRALVNRSPLGTAAGYGVNLPLDRDGVARELGFSALIVNPMAAQASRGSLEVAILSAAWQLMAPVRRFAWDVSLFTTHEFGFVTLDRSLTTGSSIMPQKRNPDVVELMRASASVVQGAVVELMSALSLPSGYHRDLQLTKAPLLRGLDEALAAMNIMPRVVRGMSLDKARMRAAITQDSFATDRAVELAKQGVPFRDAYKEVAAKLASLSGDPDASLRERVSPGAPGALDLEGLRARLAR
jgi:argininosuccinate lyase